MGKYFLSCISNKHSVVINSHIIMGNVIHVSTINVYTNKCNVIIGVCVSKSEKHHHPVFCLHLLSPRIGVGVVHGPSGARGLVSFQRVTGREAFVRCQRTPDISEDHKQRGICDCWGPVSGASSQSVSPVCNEPLDPLFLLEEMFGIYHFVHILPMIPL